MNLTEARITGHFRDAFSLFQGEASCETFHLQVKLISISNKTDSVLFDMEMSFYIQGFALDLALKQRLKVARKWAVGITQGKWSPERDGRLRAVVA